MLKTNYSLSFTSGGILHPESMTIIHHYTKSYDWVQAKEAVIRDNSFGVRTESSGKRLTRELQLRLSWLDKIDLELIGDLVSVVEQKQALWICICRTYQFISDFMQEVKGAKNQAPKTHEAIQNKNCGWFYRASSADFKKIPGSPIAYWLSEKLLSAFLNESIKDLTISDGQTKTGDNNKYLRLIWETDFNKVGTDKKWVKHPKGGEFRKWYGNLDTLINWSDEARTHYRKDHVARILPEYLWWKKGFCWTLITSSKQSFRYVGNDEIFNLAAPTLFPKSEDDLYLLLPFVNTHIAQYIVKTLNPTLNMNVGEIQSLPLIKGMDKEKIKEIAKACISLSKSDWDFYETSWDFQSLPLLVSDHLKPRIEDSYQTLRVSWQEMTDEMKRLEEENNRIFIDAYGLQDELTPDVPLEEITLTCNPYYRYGDKNTPEELEARLLSDTMQEFIHYAVGCMFGRYSIDKPGLILANQGDTIAEYKTQVPNSRFDTDEDNVIPVLDENWFEDDIVERFQKFLRVTFGEEHYKENLEFIENAIGKNLRKYFTKDFYDYHVRRFKKRPIYWMFSSPNRRPAS